MFLCVQGMTIQSTTTGADPQVITPPDTNVSVDGSNAYFGDVDVLVPSGANQGGGTLTAPVTITLKATGTNVQTEKGNALLQGATGQSTGTFQVGNSATSMPIVLVVTDAGQSNVDVS